MEEGAKEKRGHKAEMGSGRVNEKQKDKNIPGKIRIEDRNLSSKFKAWAIRAPTKAEK